MEGGQHANQPKDHQRNQMKNKKNTQKKLKMEAQYSKNLWDIAKAVVRGSLEQCKVISGNEISNHLTLT